jgi:endoglycosylceramidase
MPRRLAALVTVAALCAGTAAHAARPQRPALGYLHVGAVAGTPQLLDEAGRTVTLRGVNANGLVDYWRSDLRPPYPTDAGSYRGSCPTDDRRTTAVPLCEDDLRQMRALGFDNLRLPVSWSLLEPTPGHLDRSYVERIAQVIGWARAQGIWVVIDLHQDAWSKYDYTPDGQTCPPGTGAVKDQDGAPLWASQHRLPVCAVADVRELDPAVIEDAQTFWLNAPAADGVGLQDHYAAVVAALAKRFKDEPAVAGYDLMNEPEPGALPVVAGTAELMPFYAKVVDAMRAAAPGFHQLVMLEPGVERNTTATRYYALPWSAYSDYPNAVYAPHVYTEVFTAGAVTGLPEVTTFDSDYQAAVDDAAALGLPLWIGEFGGSPQDDARVLATHYAQQEARRISGTVWVWKEHGSWSIGASSRTTLVSRAYPVATAGTLLSAVSNPSAGTADVRATSSRVRPGDRARATLVRLPLPFNGSRLQVTGARYEVVQAGGGRDVWVYPTGGAYRVLVSR